MNKKLLIDAIMTMYVMTKREAEKYAKNIDDNMKRELVKGFGHNARKAFCND